MGADEELGRWGSAPLRHALGHSSRRRILRWMIADEEPRAASPVAAAAGLKLSAAEASYHFRVLAVTDAVEEVERRPERGTVQCFYEPTQKLLKTGWVRNVLAETAGDD